MSGMFCLDKSKIAILSYQRADLSINCLSSFSMNVVFCSFCRKINSSEFCLDASKDH